MTVLVSLIKLLYSVRFSAPTFNRQPPRHHTSSGSVARTGAVGEFAARGSGRGRGSCPASWRLVRNSGLFLRKRSRIPRGRFPRWGGSHGNAASNLVARFKNHQLGAGPSATTDPGLKPWAILAYISGFEGRYDTERSLHVFIYYIFDIRPPLSLCSKLRQKSLWCTRNTTDSLLLLPRRASSSRFLRNSCSRCIRSRVDGSGPESLRDSPSADRRTYTRETPSLEYVSSWSVK